MNKVWVIDVRERGRLNLTFTKVVDAPKYMVQKYAKQVLSSLGLHVRKGNQQGTVYYGFDVPVRSISKWVKPVAIVELHIHIIRDRSWLTNP